MEQKLTQTQDLKLLLSSNTYWDHSLVQTEENPFPLAPKSLIAQGLLSEEIYLKENQTFGNSVSNIMRAEPPMGSVCGLGFGLGRDYEWFPERTQSIQHKFYIIDSSQVACDNAKNFLKRCKVNRKVKIIQSDVFEVWGNMYFDFDEKIVNTYYISQFLQHIEQMPEFMSHLGTFLKGPDRRIYLVTPLPEDNPPEKVKFNNSTLFSVNEWKGELEKGLGGRAEVQRLGLIPYFNQNYTLFRVEK